jgi:predicted dehydrogenase
MRIGLVGTGHWATTVYAPVLVDHPDVELVGIWGRNPERVQRAAADAGVQGFADFGNLLEEVEAVAFAVPPDVQAPLAIQAAKARRHLLLEKPIATSSSAAAELARQATDSGVRSVVFFTSLFAPETRAWLDSVRRTEGWYGGTAEWLAATFSPGSPYEESLWRQQKGGLWDVGPHAVAVLTVAVGRITSVVAYPGRLDLVHLVAEHEGGQTSTVTLTLRAPAAAAGTRVELGGEAGRSIMPAVEDPNTALAVAVDHLCRSVRDGGRTSPDVAFGAYVVDLLAEAERQCSGSGRSE